MIYVVQEEYSRLVKIGFSRDPWLRHNKMQADCPGKLTILCLEDGDAEYERSLHRRFAADRVRGEWFRYSLEIAAHVERVGPPERPNGRDLSDNGKLVAAYMQATGVAPATARGWVQRGRVPTCYWASLQHHGIATVAELANAAARRKNIPAASNDTAAPSEAA